MFQAYIATVRESKLDWFILIFGGLLIFAHLVGLCFRVYGRRRWAVQGLERYRTFLHLLTELLPILGLLGTVLGLMDTFQSIQVGGTDKSANLSVMIQSFAPAMSTTISGLIMVVPNLLLNAFLWLAAPTVQEGAGSI